MNAATGLIPGWLEIAQASGIGTVIGLILAGFYIRYGE